MDFKKYIIISGHFGSGKTEISINLAHLLKNASNKVCLVDFDIVNPYFRANDSRTELENRGIEVITPIFAGSNVDVPALPGKINKLFQTDYDYVIFDTGGDDMGAKAIARYKEFFRKVDYEHICIVNYLRPETDTKNKAIALMNEIQISAKLNITSFISNSVLFGAFSSGTFKESIEISKLISKETGIEFKGSVLDEGCPNKYINRSDILKIKRFTKFPWEI